MAELYGVNYKKAYVDADKAKYNPGEYNGHVKTLYDEHVFEADVNAQNDTILIGKLPVGARVVGGGVRAESMGTTGIFDLGVTGDANGIVDGADAGGQAAVKLASTESYVGTKVAVETDVFLTIDEATDDAATKKVAAWVHYIVD